MLTTDVLIPVYRPGKRLSVLLNSLKEQSYPIHKIILMNTEKQYFPKGLDGKWRFII